MFKREMRLAVVIYGGASLAIYMHGVSKELLKLVRASKILHEVGADRAATSWRIFKVYGTELQQTYYDLVTRMRGMHGFGADAVQFPEAELETTRRWLYYRAASIYSGSNEVQRNIIAKRVLGLPD